MSAYKTMFDDIKIFAKTVDMPVSSLSGDIIIEMSKTQYGVRTNSGDIKVVQNSIIGAEVQSTCGDIKVKDSKVFGNVAATSGDIEISNTEINGNVAATVGDIEISNTEINGNVAATSGDIEIKGCKIIGTLKVSLGNLKLHGGNSLQNIVFKPCGGVSNSIITSRNGGTIVIGGSSTVTINGKKIDLDKIAQTNEPESTPEFKLPAGNEVVGTVEFMGKIPGKLFIDAGARFIGRVKNGTVHQR